MYFLVQSGSIPQLKIGRNIRIREQDLVKWLEQNQVDGFSPFFPHLAGDDRMAGQKGSVGTMVMIGSDPDVIYSLMEPLLKKPSPDEGGETVIKRYNRRVKKR